MSLALSSASVAEEQQLPTEAKVLEVLTGASAVIETGERIVLSGVRAPDQSSMAKRALEALIQGRKVKLQYQEPLKDRYGRLRVALSDMSGNSVAQALVAQGAVFVDGADPALQAAERAARNTKKGLWSLPEFQPITPEEAAQHIHAFRLVRGTVQKTHFRPDFLNIHFSPDWKSDFTLSIPKRDWPKFDLEAVKAWEGAELEVRGWIAAKEGPMMRLTHPGQVEILRIAPVSRTTTE